MLVHLHLRRTLDILRASLFSFCFFQFVTYASFSRRLNPESPVLNDYKLILNRSVPPSNTSKVVATQQNETDSTSWSLRKLGELGIELTESYRELPRREDIEETHGPDPVIVGLETCATFRQAVPNQEKRQLAPAGMFNTGTNLLPVLLMNNCQNLTIDLFQVNWGKHNPSQARLNNFTIPKPQYQSIPVEEVLPIVLVRHPISWMKSTCRHKYGAKWAHNFSNCPHLMWENETDSVFVEASFGWNPLGGRSTRYSSLLHMWKEWYAGYWKFPYPRLMIRLEDLVYHLPYVLGKVCECAGGSLRSGRMKVLTHSAKELQEETLIHGRKTAGLIDAWVEQPKVKDMWEELPRRDKKLVHELLRGDEMFERFKYKIQF